MDENFNKKWGAEVNYTILSMCVGDYYSAFNITVPSWMKPSVEKVVVYTDKEYECEDERVEIRPELNFDNSGWIPAVGKKVNVVKNFLKTCECRNLVFLDMDCVMVRDVAPVYKNEFDLAACPGKKTANAGTWYSRVNKNLIEFVDKWGLLQKQYYNKGKGLTPHVASYHQHAFTDLLSTINFYPVDGHIYCSRRSLYRSSHKKWKKAVAERDVKLLHFVHDTWRDENFVKEMVQLAEK